MKWQKKATRAFTLRLHRENDADIIGYLESAENKQGAIKEALRDAMKKDEKK